ncbi:endo-1,4-beta-xylanase 5-like [Henckelia pumila]|uniref:endo-1,4-beta-xylanase 5-like n=1 Tax=Henckelia pumila TaxID=405737 RepID=UPI003C6E8F10
MAKLLKNCLFFFLVLCLEQGLKIHAVPYDYRFTNECLKNPLGPQYGGGIVTNPEINKGLEGWARFGGSIIKNRQSKDGNKYIVASNRSHSFHSFSQRFLLEKEKLYTFSAWLQVSDGEAHIAAMFQTKDSYETAGWVIARNGCWSMLKGGLVVKASGPAHLYFQSDNAEVDIWADSISLQPFTHEEWQSHQHQSVQKMRKNFIKFHVLDKQGRPISNATVSIKQNGSRFPFGCAMNQNILQNAAYQNWFLARFKYSVFENEMKWYSTERSPGAEDYSVADSMLRFAQSHGITVRGHNVFWDNPSRQPWWVGGLPPNNLRAASQRRINSVVGRYRGQLIHWDVMNENLHYSFFESKLGGSVSAGFYQQANRIDPKATPFLNEYNTIEESRDPVSSPPKYLQKISEMRGQGYNGPLGIGLQGHFTDANLPYLRSSLDTLASAGLPIWVTELDVKSGPNQANYLDQILREIHAHAAVRGIILWSAWSPGGCYAMCLTDNNFKSLATGDVVDRFIRTLNEADGVRETTDARGVFGTSLFHGEYEAEISHPLGVKTHKFSVAPNESQEEEKEEGTGGLVYEIRFKECKQAPIS